MPLLFERVTITRRCGHDSTAPCYGTTPNELMDSVMAARIVMGQSSCGPCKAVGRDDAAIRKELNQGLHRCDGSHS